MIFLTFFIRNYSYASIKTSIDNIGHDILNLSAIFEKYFIFLKYMSTEPEKYKMILIRTEFEYFFGVIRSLYDLLQVLIKHFVIYHMKKELPNSFNDMFYKETYEIKSNYSYLPQQLKIYYKSSTGLLVDELTDMRDRIYHNGTTNNFITYSEEGFGIRRNLFDFLDFGEWPQNKVKENNIISLLAVFAYITKAVIKNMNDLSLALSGAFHPPKTP